MTSVLARGGPVPRRSLPFTASKSSKGSTDPRAQRALARHRDCGDPAPAWHVGMCAACNSIPVFVRRDTARYRTKGYNGSNSHPKAGLSWPMAYPYSPMLPSFLAVVNVEGAHTGTTTDPLRGHPTPTALPQELHRCDLESPHFPHNRRRTHAPPQVPPSRKT